MRGFAAIVLGAGLCGCVSAPVLLPATPSVEVPGDRTVAGDLVSGVRVEVDGSAWDGAPSDLGRIVTPVLVRLTNGSGRSLRVRYGSFSLEGRSGFLYSALPPLTLRGLAVHARPGFRPAAVRERRFVFRARPHGFFFAPYYAPFFALEVPLWGGPFPFDPYLYERAYAGWPGRLPTRDMVERALPEGVLQEGGDISGFVYFPDVARRETDVVFRGDLEDAGSGERFGAARLPLVVRR